MLIPDQEAAVDFLNYEAVAKTVVCSPDPQRHIAQIRQYIDAGYGHVYVHQVGPDQEGFMRFYQREVLPQLQRG